MRETSPGSKNFPVFAAAVAGSVGAASAMCWMVNADAHVPATFGSEESLVQI